MLALLSMQTPYAVARQGLLLADAKKRFILLRNWAGSGSGSWDLGLKLG